MVSIFTDFYERGDLLITSHDDESLVGNASLLQDIQEFLVPAIIDTNSVKIPVQTIVLTTKGIRLRPDKLIVRSIRRIPGVMSDASKVRQKESLMVALSSPRGSTHQAKSQGSPRS